MRSLLIVVVFALHFSPSFAQQGGKVIFSSQCQQFDYCYDCGEQKAVFLGKLKKYFEKEINPRDLDLIHGIIVVEIAVDSAGNACANGFYNRTSNTTNQIMLLNLDRIVANMPKWEPATIGGTYVNSYVPLIFYSHVDQHGIFDVNYLRHDLAKLSSAGENDANASR